jgi:hypothetical protein
VMYNLTVDEAHTFFVGDGQWLVHNVCIMGYVVYGGNPMSLAAQRFRLEQFREPSANVAVFRVEGQAQSPFSKKVNRLLAHPFESVSSIRRPQ